MKKIKKIAIIGLGKHSLEQIRLITNYRKDIEINLLIDNQISSYYRVLSKFNNKINAQFSLNTKNILSNNIDLVYISTLADSHVEITEELINFGYKKDIIIEKPLSNSLKKAKRLFKTIKNKKWEGRILIGFYRRNNLIFRKINNFIKEDKLKSLREIKYFNPIELSMNGSHWIDISNWLNKSNIESVKSKFYWNQTPGRRGAKIIDPFCDLKINYINNVKFHLNNFKNDQGNLLELYFQNSKVTVDYSEEKAEISFFDDGSTLKIEGSKEKSFINFLNSIENNDPDLALIKSGIDVLEVITAAHISNRSGKIFKFPVKISDNIDLDVA